MTACDLRSGSHRRRTFRRRVGAAVAAVGLAVCASLPASAASNAKSSKYYDNAIERLEKSDVRGAVIQLRNALKEDPDMAAGHMLMGNLQLKYGDPAGAEASLDRALRNGASRLEVALPMAQAYAAQGKLDALLEQASPDGLPLQPKREILLLRGIAQEKKDDHAAAERTFEEARAIDPYSVPVRLALANTLLSAGQAAKAASLVDEAIKLAPKDPSALIMRASIALRKGDLKAALADYSKAIALDPGSLDAMVAEAGVLIDLGRMEEAERALADLEKFAPNEPYAAYMRAVMASRRDEVAAMRADLAKVVKTLDLMSKDALVWNGQALMLGALSHYSLGDMDAAALYLDRYVKAHPKRAGPRKLLASIYVDQGKNGRAVDLLEPMLQTAPNDIQVLALLAAARMAEGRHFEATNYFEKALKLSGSANVRAEFGVSLIASGQEELGFRQVQQAFAKDQGQVRSGMVLATWYLKREQTKKAVEVIDTVVRRNPKSATATNLQGIARMAAGDRPGARAAYDKALALDPRSSAIRLNVVRLDLAEGKLDAARADLWEVFKLNPKNADAMVEAARVEEFAGRRSEAVRWLEKAMTDPTEQVKAALALSDLMLRQHDFERAVKLTKEASSRAPNDVSVLFALSRAQLAAGNLRSAQQALGVLLSVAGFNPNDNVEIARLFLLAGDRDSAYHTVNKALQDTPNFLPALAFLTEVDISGGNFAKAEQQAKRIAERFPNRGVGLRLMGELAATRGQYTAAETSFNASLAKEKSVETVMLLYRTLLLAGEPARGLKVLEQWSRENPNDASGLRALADAQVRAGDLAAARTRYERLLRVNRNDVEVLNNLAMVAFRQNDKAALGYAERAYQLTTTHAPVLDTLGWILVRQGQLDRGTSLLREARTRDSANPEIRYHYAAALAQTGRQAEARAELNEGLNQGAAFAEIEDARALQRKLGS